MVTEPLHLFEIKADSHFALPEIHTPRREALVAWRGIRGVCFAFATITARGCAVELDHVEAGPTFAKAMAGK